MTACVCFILSRVLCLKNRGIEKERKSKRDKEGEQEKESEKDFPSSENCTAILIEVHVMKKQNKQINVRSKNKLKTGLRGCTLDHIFKVTLVPG